MTTILHHGTVLTGTTRGNLDEAPASGLYIHDTRILRQWAIHLSTGQPAVVIGESTTADSTQIAYAPQGLRNEDPGIIATRSQRVRAGGLDETVTVTSTRDAPALISIDICGELDFGDQFALRSDGRHPPQRGIITHDPASTAAAQLRYRSASSRGEFHAEAAVTTAQGLPWTVTLSDDGSVARIAAQLSCHLAPGQSTSLKVSVDAHTQWHPAQGSTGHSTPPEEPHARQAAGATPSRALADLDALTMPCPGLPHLMIPAAGAPWFVTLFGRDSLLTAMMVDDARPELLPDVLQALAHYQGQSVDPTRLEEPGKVVHEVRIDELARHGTVPYGQYYGTVDATALFVMAVGQLARRTTPPEALLHRLETPVRRAIAWIQGPGGLESTGFVRYTAHDGGLINHGWKDSEDAVCFPDGTPAQGAIALAEVQGYAWRALVDAAALALHLWDDPAWAQELGQAADALAQRFDHAFWMPEHNYPALALDGDDRQVPVLGSHGGHLLWSGILESSRAEQVARWLTSPAFFSGWGIRTVAATEPRYRPGSYHCGSVWPHDTALAILGLDRCGFPAQAATIADGLAAATKHLGRLPELFSGHDRGRFPVPLRIPHAASPQSWSCAAAVVAQQFTATP